MMHPEEVAIVTEWAIQRIPFPKGCGTSDAFWRAVDGPSGRFMALVRQTRPGDERGTKRLQDEAKRLVATWRAAARQYAEAAS